MEVSCQLHAPAALIPDRSPGIIRIRGMVVPRTGLEKRKISYPRRDSQPGPTSRWPCCYVNYASPDPLHYTLILFVHHHHHHHHHHHVPEGLGVFPVP